MKQLRILHISDVHFGDNHRCDPEDITHPSLGYPKLFDLVQSDLANEFFEHPTWRPGTYGTSNRLLVMVTGDLTDRATPKEFKLAHSFLSKFGGASLLGSETTLGDLFLVPGNHDVDYNAEDIETRLTPYANFYSKLYSGTRPAILPHEAGKLTQVHVSREHSYIVVEIDSAAYVKRGTEDAQRGMIDLMAIKEIDSALEAIPEHERDSMIRIAIMHHHPILVPELVEPGRGYDAMGNSNYLLKLLRQYGFQLVLHGHKHYPNIFTYDSDSPWQERTTPSMLVVAGGSSSSRELPDGQRRHNTYNLISIKWHREASQARIRIVTRGLVAEDGSGPLAPHKWKWVTLRDIDRHLNSAYDPTTPVSTTARRFDLNLDGAAEAKRSAAYRETRRNMVVSEVLPSLLPGQTYEARCWLVTHVDSEGKPKQDEEDQLFRCAFNYWGPMLVQAEMYFADGTRGYAQTYARIPGLE
jgi:3',5'-cyclic AMP phosphodiesterase CpdA